MANPLIDKMFLRQLDEFPLREIYAKIIALDNNEFPREEIQGRATGGSVNLDGTSAVRRTCSLTLLADNLDLRDYYWGLNNKFKLEIGMKNFINSNYADIIWFPQGVYIITQFNTSQNATGYTISISGKDKMVLLNGEVGGKIHANSTRFDIIEEYDKDGNRSEIKIPIKEIIQQLIHEYGNEPMHNIIINDIDDYGIELLEYRGDSPAYMTIDAISGLPIKFSTKFKSNSKYKIIDFAQNLGAFISALDESDQNKESIADAVSNGTFVFDPMVSNAFMRLKRPTYFSAGDRPYSVAKINFGDTAGYRLTELTYPGELVVSAGETITGVLDKFKTMLNDFEYFYDINGRFIFQRKPIYVNQSWSPLKSDFMENRGGQTEKYAESMVDISPFSYQFEDNKLLTQISNTPNFSNIKNDFSIWGKRKTMSGAEVPIHLRFAIQKKPIIYRKISDAGEYPKGTLFINESVQGINTIESQADISKANIDTLNERAKRTNDLLQSILQTSDIKEAEGITGIVQTDWRELIYQMAIDYRNQHYQHDFESRLSRLHNFLYLNGKTGYEQYYVDMEAFWRQIYNPSKRNEDGYNEWGWNKDIEENPQGLNFWIDFLDTDGEISKYSVDAIGDRAQIVNNDKIQAIYYKDTPLVIFYNSNSNKAVDTNREKTGYSYIPINNIESLFSISSQGQTAKDELDNQLQNYTFANEAISLTSLPIYYLEPNTRIQIKSDEDRNLNGEYIISRITLPLTYNGTMNISATKDPQTLL